VDSPTKTSTLPKLNTTLSPSSIHSSLPTTKILQLAFLFQNNTINQCRVRPRSIYLFNTTHFLQYFSTLTFSSSSKSHFHFPKAKEKKINCNFRHSPFMALPKISGEILLYV